MNRLKIEEIRRRRNEDRRKKFISHEVRSPLERPITFLLNKQNRLIHHETHRYPDGDPKSRADRVSLSILPSGHKASKLVKIGNDQLPEGFDLPAHTSYQQRIQHQISSTSTSSTGRVDRDHIIFEAVEIISGWMMAEPAFIDPQTAYGSKDLRFMDCVANKLRVYKAQVDPAVVEMLSNARVVCHKTPAPPEIGFDCIQSLRVDSDLSCSTSRICVKTPLRQSDLALPGTSSGSCRKILNTPCVYPRTAVRPTRIPSNSFRPPLLHGNQLASEDGADAIHLVANGTTTPPSLCQEEEVSSLLPKISPEVARFMHHRLVVLPSPSRRPMMQLNVSDYPPVAVRPPSLDYAHSPCTERQGGAQESSFPGRDLRHPIWDTPEELKTSRSKFIMFQ